MRWVYMSLCIKSQKASVKLQTAKWRGSVCLVFLLTCSGPHIPNLALEVVKRANLSESQEKKKDCGSILVLDKHKEKVEDGFLVCQTLLA